MLEAILLGLLAGYAIAIPVGPIALLILRIGIHDGARPALAAGAGAATADLVYASAAVLVGPPLVTVIAPALVPARLVAAALLLALAARQLRQAGLPPAGAAAATAQRTYATVLALTLLNPATVVYFASLAVGLPALSSETTARALFAAGAALASLSWQWLLAGSASALHGRVPPPVERVTAFVSAALIAALAVWIGWEALAPYQTFV